MSSRAMYSKLLVMLCMILVSLAIILQGASAARDLTHTVHASRGRGLGGYYWYGGRNNGRTYGGTPSHNSGGNNGRIRGRTPDHY
ncbi:hypothetical protein SEVIR_8G181650v4 [Setaria viridis]|uniref:Glycine-rich protein n=2 Tax=Setaria TaxID=4554 RepID=K3ZLM6_SETIT|nr:hypothetical protein SETIT_8G172300v2 [Setaria italica]RCV38817.1 hypothetical protein SETIT_8G172500v2 [Setaria italica]TKW01452.1 hypothetical protein SEVIR_8G181650v2 [Setaria viridis]